MPMLAAHRSDCSTAPENTLSAFSSALAAGEDGIELHVRLTLERQLIVLHDRRLDHTSGSQGPMT